MVISSLVTQALAIYAFFSLLLLNYQEFAYGKSIIKHLYKIGGPDDASQDNEDERHQDDSDEMTNSTKIHI